MKTLLTDRFLRGLRQAPLGKRLVIWDAAVPGLCVRVTDKGVASYAVMRRIKGRPQPVRRKIGIAWRVPFPASVPLPYSLTQARQDAREAVLAMVHGEDPKSRWEAAKNAMEEALRGAFNAVAEDFIKDHVSKLRSAHDMAATIRKEIVPIFSARMIGDIGVDEVARMIKNIAKDRPSQARTVYHHASKLWSWAIAQRCYGVATSPFTVLSAKDLLGRAPQGDRVLSDSELLAVWEAAGAIPYPGGPLVRFLQLTGLRLREAAELSWPEIDLSGQLITIPGSRMKNGTAFTLPLAPAALAILEEFNVPERPGRYVFSTSGGVKPVSFFSKLKARIDEILRAVGAIEPWTFHDLRRSLRTNLSMLGVPDVVSELVLAHAQRGLHRTYDRHACLDEKRQALVKWEARLCSLVEPQDNVVTLVGRR